MLGLVVAAAASACSDETATELRWTVDLSSQQQNLRQVGPDNRSVYGWNRLTGATTVGGRPVEVDMLGNVSYTRGNGPFFGFVTLIFPDGSTIGMRMEGNTEANTDTADAAFHGTVSVLGGTGAYEEAAGSGRMTGTREARLGGLVRMDFLLRLEAPD